MIRVRGMSLKTDENLYFAKILYNPFLWSQKNISFLFQNYEKPARGCFRKRGGSREGSNINEGELKKLSCSISLIISAFCYTCACSSICQSPVVAFHVMKLEADEKATFLKHFISKVYWPGWIAHFFGNKIQCVPIKINISKFNNNFVKLHYYKDN